LLRGDIAASDFLDRLGTSPTHPSDGRIKRWLAPLVRVPHRCMYDTESLCAAMASAGFDVEPAERAVSRIADIAALEGDGRRRSGAIAEGTKPPVTA